MVLELRYHRALDRPVPGVVHAGRHLVGEQCRADLEELDREDADVAQGVHDPARDRDRASVEVRADARRRCA